MIPALLSVRLEFTLFFKQIRRAAGERSKNVLKTHKLSKAAAPFEIRHRIPFSAVPLVSACFCKKLYVQKIDLWTRNAPENFHTFEPWAHVRVTYSRQFVFVVNWSSYKFCEFTKVRGEVGVPMCSQSLSEKTSPQRHGGPDNFITVAYTYLR